MLSLDPTAEGRRRLLPKALAGLSRTTLVRLGGRTKDCRLSDLFESAHELDRGVGGSASVFGTRLYESRLMLLSRDGGLASP